MRRPHGYFYGSADATHGRAFEADSCMCPHCNAHFVVIPNATPAQLGQFCTNCMAQCCVKPSCNAGCRPFMKAIEAQEAKARLRAALCLLILLLASPVWAQPFDCTVTRPSKDETRVECPGGGSDGLRIANGKRYRVKQARDPLKLWMGKSWKATEVEPLPDELPPLVSLDVVTRAVSADTTFTHDWLALWTPRAEQAAGGSSNMLATIVLTATLATQAYANSGVPLTLRVVGAEKVVYTESSISTDLNRLQGKTDGYLDAIHARRVAVGADLVSLVGEGYAAAGACGVGYVLGAFNVIDRSCATGNLSGPHELGHNQGLQHDPPNACGQAVCNGYNYGHGWGPARDVMAYPSAGGTRVTQFSSPLVLHSGLPTGIAGQRDNARKLRETAATVAGWTPTVNTTPVPPPQTISEWSAPQTIFNTASYIGFGDDGGSTVYALNGRKFRRSLDEGLTWEPELSLPGTRVDAFLERPLAGLGPVVAVVALDIQNWSSDWLGTRPTGALVLYVSTNRGASFVGPLRATPTNEQALRWSVAVGPDGRVHWVWMNYTGSSWVVKYAHYTNGVVSAPVVLATGVGPVGAERPSIAINGTTLAVTWLDGRDNIGVPCTYEGNKPIPDCPEVYVRRSVDGGGNWQPAVRLTFDATTYSGRSLITGDGATAFALFYDKRPQGAENSLWQFRSTDNGATWTESLVSDEAGDENHASAALRGTDGVAAWVKGSSNRSGRSFDTAASWGAVEGLSSAVATPMVAATTNYLHVYTMTYTGQLQVRRALRTGGSPPPPPPPPPDPCVVDPLVPPAAGWGWPSDQNVTKAVITQVGRNCPAIEVLR